MWGYSLASGNGPALRNCWGVAMASSIRTRAYVRPVLAALTAIVVVLGGATLANAEEPSSFTTVPTPVIVGTVAVGQTLSASYDASLVDPTPDSAFLTWFVGGINVGNADNLGLQPGDVGKVITVRLTVLKAGYADGTAVSADSAPVALGTQSFTPVISGSLGSGSTLSVTGLPPEATFAYRWKRSGSPISGAVNATYKLTTSDIGKTITVTVTATRPGYTTLAKTSASTTTIKRAFSATYTPAVSGTAKVGYTLKATTKTWSPNATLKYQWYRNGIAISGATASTRKLTGSDSGAIITVKVTGSRSGYLTVTKTSKATAIIAKGSISAPTPKISGTTRAGATLKLTVGTVSPSNATKTYQWYRNGVAVAGATTSSFALKNVDAGKKITVKVTYAATGYNTKTLTSAATATIATRSGSMTYDTIYSPTLPDYFYVAPGLYVTNNATEDCYWVRDDDDDAYNGEIVEYWGPGRWIVEIASTDAVFYTEYCGTWIKYDGTGSNASSIAKDGYYGIGIDVRPGRYTRSGGDTICYATLESNASGEFDAIEQEFDLGIGDEVIIDGDGKFFTTWGCGTWTRVGDVPVAG